MMKKILILCSSLLVVTLSMMGAQKVSATHLRTLNFEEAWQEGEFQAQSLQNVIQLYPKEDFLLSDHQKDQLLDSKALINLKVMDLHAQNVNDIFVSRLCQNKTYARLTTLDLTENPNVTDESLTEIAQSDILGSIRDLPSISGRYGRPSSEIRIKINGTNISEDSIRRYNAEPCRTDFAITYLQLLTNKPTAHKVPKGLKWLQLESY